MDAMAVIVLSRQSRIGEQTSPTSSSSSTILSMYIYTEGEKVNSCEKAHERAYDISMAGDGVSGGGELRESQATSRKKCGRMCHLSD